MPRLLKEFQDKSVLEYDQGKFDGWCVYLRRPGGLKYAPKDAEYFLFFYKLKSKDCGGFIYPDFNAVYEKTGKITDDAVFQMITLLSEKYGADSLESDIWFSVIYAGMVAEENKQNAILKKRIKKLGMHQTLIENMPPGIAANFVRGKSWREIDALCRERGF